MSLREKALALAAKAARPDTPENEANTAARILAGLIDSNPDLLVDSSEPRRTRRAPRDDEEGGDEEDDNTPFDEEAFEALMKMAQRFAQGMNENDPIAQRARAARQAGVNIKCRRCFVVNGHHPECPNKGRF